MLQTVTASSRASLTAPERLIVALDTPTLDQSKALVEKLGEEVLFYKVGWRQFFHGGLDFVRELKNAGKNVFLDLKMDDIAETIETAVMALPVQVEFLTVQGSAATAAAAARGSRERGWPKLLFVTFLSSLDAGDLQRTFSLAEPPDLEKFILKRAADAVEAGCEGLIASGDSIRAIREKLGPDPIIVSPGIRPSGGALDDHKRSATPAAALRAGSDYLVIGRPIWGATDPLGAARSILEEMDGALR